MKMIEKKLYDRSSGQDDVVVPQLMMIAYNYFKSGNTFISKAKSSDQGVDSSAFVIEEKLNTYRMLVEKYEALYRDFETMGDDTHDVAQAEEVLLTLEEQIHEIDGDLSWDDFSQEVNEWIQTLSNNPFDFKMRQAIENNEWKNRGIIVFAMNKMFEDSVKAQVEADSPDSDYVGQIGDRLDLTVTIEKTLLVEGNFGSSYLILMSDADGNKIVTFNSGKFSEKVSTGQTTQVRGTVKQHKVFNNEKRTVMTRMAVC